MFKVQSRWMRVIKGIYKNKSPRYRFRDNLRSKSPEWRVIENLKCTDQVQFKISVGLVPPPLLILIIFKIFLFLFELCGLKIIIFELCGLKIIIFELCGLKIIIFELCGLKIIIFELCGLKIIIIPKMMFGPADVRNTSR